MSFKNSCWYEINDGELLKYGTHFYRFKNPYSIIIVTKKGYLTKLL